MTALRSVLLIALTVAWIVVGGEALQRCRGGWRFNSLRLEPRPTAPASHTSSAKSERALVASLTTRSDTDVDWFFLPPVTMSKPSNADLVQRAKENPTSSGLENYIWNSAILAQGDPSAVAAIRAMKVENLFVFRSYDQSVFPRFRLYPDNDFRPTPWITNHWGWVSPDVSFVKPPRTIRIGIVGDSTSHNLYAFHLQTYLNKWAEARRFDVRFEVLNASRQGLGRDDGLAALRFELAPMGLDIVYIYYAPAFSLSIAQMAAWATLPTGVQAGHPPAATAPNRNTPLQKWCESAGQYSALVRRCTELANREAPDSILPEPEKPRAVLHVDPTTDPYFSTLARQLDAVKVIADEHNFHVAVSSERLCAWEDMVMTKGANSYLYKTLNGPLFWPFTYAQLRTMVGMHNATIAKWARKNGVMIVDIDGQMPRQPSLYSDAHHDIPVSQKLRAWLIFQTLATTLEKGILDGSLPRKNGPTSGSHPYLERPIETMDRKEYLRKLDAGAAHHD